MGLTHVSSKGFEKEVLKNKLPVIVDFYADWCGPCKMMAPMFEEIAGEYKGKVSFMKLDTEEETELAQKYRIMSIPALVVFSSGKEIGRIIGFMPKESLKKKIDEIVKK